MFLYKERVFIIGANASGKSNMLDAFRFLRDIAKEGGGLQEAVRIRGGISKIRCLFARKEPAIRIAVEVSENKSEQADWKYEIILKQSGGGIRDLRAEIVSEIVWKADKKILSRPLEGEENDPLQMQFTALEQASANKEFRALNEFFKQIEYQHIVPQLVREQIISSVSTNMEDFFGRSLLESISKINERTRKSYLLKIENALKIAIPRLSNLSLEKDEMGKPHLVSVYENWRPHGAKQNEQQFSDGTLRMIGLFWSMLVGKEPLLLEEPEISLNSEIVRRLPEIIALLQIRKKDKRQIILSTHSYDLLDNKGIMPDEIIIVKQESEGSKAYSAANVQEIKSGIMNGLSPAILALSHSNPEDIYNIANALK